MILPFAAVRAQDQPPQAQAIQPGPLAAGQTYLRQKEYQKAFDEFQRVASSSTQLTARATLWMAIARSHEKDADPASVEDLFRSATHMAPPDSKDAALFGTIFAGFLEKEGKKEEAEALRQQVAATRAALATAYPKPHFDSPVHRVGAGVTAPKLVKKAEPDYAEEARLALLGGTVVLYVEIGPDGAAHNIRVLRELGMGLDEKAIEAVSQWHFEPGVIEGQPVTVAATIEVNFRLL